MTRSRDIELWRDRRRHIENGAARYDRFRHLPRLIPNCAPLMHARPAVVAETLHDKILIARKRRRENHWSYSLNHHYGLLQAWLAETRAAAALRPSPFRPVGVVSPHAASAPEKGPGVVHQPSRAGVRALTIMEQAR